MRTTITVDENLLRQARSLTQISGNNDLVREGLRALIQRESAKRLALLGGSDPQATVAPRRQSSEEK